MVSSVSAGLLWAATRQCCHGGEQLAAVGCDSTLLSCFFSEQWTAACVSSGGLAEAVDRI
jgi:hypothetical protein